MMPPTLSAAETRRFRILAQGLNGPDDGSASLGAAAVADIVRRSGGIQAQDANAAMLQIRVRGAAALTAMDVREALEEDRSIVRSWAMRGTLHIFPAEDYDWLVALTGPAPMAASRAWRAGLGLHDTTVEAALRLTGHILAEEGPLPRPQLAERLGARDIPVEGQALNHILRYAGFAGLLCHGPVIDGSTETFAAIDSWLPPAGRASLTRSEALVAAGYALREGIRPRRAA